MCDIDMEMLDARWNEYLSGQTASIPIKKSMANIDNYIDQKKIFLKIIEIEQADLHIAEQRKFEDGAEARAFFENIEK